MSNLDPRSTTFFAAAEHDASHLSARRALGDEIYETLLSRLISLAIAPGSRIAVDALVRELGVSQTPIRAALIRLENEGLVVKTHNVGYSAAAMPTRDRFKQIYDMRMLLEPYAAAEAAQLMDDAALAELKTLAESMENVSGGNAQVAYGKFALQDAKFHAWIAACSGNELIAETLSRLHAHMHVFRLRFHSRVTEEAITEHADIVKALCARDAEAARDAMAHHIACSRDRMAPFFDNL
ncbi:GntR family transcriptional regulator [Pandoraea norimbergensis]|uniref:GntR family transcriptional regulator n=1 Tax=Pandoraea norimbergensis TaxID=93219 RepID=UPI000A053FF7|nr:GntR family transcriptional regulator [Pandoraea norimbergensis]